MKSIFVVIMALSLNAFGFDVQKRDGALWLEAGTCDEVDRIGSTLLQWSRTASIPFSCKLNPPVRKQNVCSLDISRCVPEHVLQLHGSAPEAFGPNCWNSALMTAGLLPAIRYSRPEEMTFYMNSALCRPLALNEKRLPGDIGAVRKSNGEEVHGFVWLDQEMTYSKNSFDFRPYALQSLDQMYGKFFVDENPLCRGNRIDESCAVGTDFFRCQPISSTPRSSQVVMKALDAMTSLEKCLVNKVNAHRRFAATIKCAQHLPTTTQALDDLIRSTEDDFLTRSVYERLESALEQIYFFHDMREDMDVALKPRAEALAIKLH